MADVTRRLGVTPPGTKVKIIVAYQVAVAARMPADGAAGRRGSEDRMQNEGKRT